MDPRQELELESVEMATEQDADKAIKQFHEYQLDGRALTVNEARPKAQRGGGRW